MSLNINLQKLKSHDYHVHESDNTEVRQLGSLLQCHEKSTLLRKAMTSQTDTRLESPYPQMPVWYGIAGQTDGWTNGWTSNKLLFIFFICSPFSPKSIV